MRKILKAIAIVLLVVEVGFSQSFFSPIAGHIPMFYSSRSLGLGFVSFASDGLPVALEINPAMIHGSGKVVFTTSLGMKRIFEKRSFPVIDSFGDFLTNNVYVANKNYYLNGSFGVIYRPFGRLSIGLNISSWDMSYFRYVEEVRGMVYGYYNRDPLVGYHMMGSSSKVVSYTFGLSAQVFKGFNCGVSVSEGVEKKVDYFYEVDVIESFASSENLAVDKDIEVRSDGYKDIGRRINVGMTYNMNKRVRLGFFCSSPYVVEINNPPYILYPDTGLSLPAVFVDTVGVVSSVKYKYPLSYGVSIKYSPQNVLPTKFYVEVSRKLWKDFEMEVACQDSATGNLLRGSFDFENNLLLKVGVEHDFFSGAVLRVGFCHYGSPISASLNRAWITAGTAYKGKNFVVDFSVAFTSGEYMYPDLFPVKGQERISDDTVSETTIIGKVGFTYKF